MLFGRFFNCTGIRFSTNYNLLPYPTIVRPNFDWARIFNIKCSQKCVNTVLDASDLCRHCWVQWETAASGSLSRPNINALKHWLINQYLTITFHDTNSIDYVTWIAWYTLNKMPTSFKNKVLPLKTKNMSIYHTKYYKKSVLPFDMEWIKSMKSCQFSWCSFRGSGWIVGVGLVR